MGSSLVRTLKWRFSAWNRRQKAEHIQRYIDEHGVKTVVLVGAARRKGKVSGLKRTDGVVEDAIAAVAQVVGACDLVVSTSQNPYPYPFVRGNGLALPYQSGSVDLVFSNAVIEHVGDEAEQLQFMREAARVGRHWMVTTPNRWFPIESHTNAVLKHWSPRWRDKKKKRFTRLLSRKEFAQLLPPGSRLIGRPWSATFIAMGAPSGAASDRAQ